MKNTIAFFLLTLLLNSATVFGQARTVRTERDFTASYDSYIRNTLEKIPDIPGIAIVVISGDMPIFMRAYGMADKEAGKKADVDTMFYIASSTKSFTALAAAMLDKEGKIKFNDPVTKYTQRINFKTPLPDKITVRDLLTHTSGLTNDALVNRMAFTGQIDKDQIAHVFTEGTTLNEAQFGKYRYTNLGYNIYGLLLENQLKLKWQDLLQKRIFDLMGLKHSTAYPSLASTKKWTLAAPYIFDDQAGAVIRSVLGKTDNNMQSAGGMFMSISDLGKWLNMNMNGGKLGGKQIIAAEFIRFAHTGYTKTTRQAPPFSGEGEYGLGWQIGKYRTDKVIYHHGGFAGYRSHVSFMPDRKIAVGVLVNNDQAGGRAADMLATYAYDWWAGLDNIEVDYAKRLDDFASQYTGIKQQMIASAAERAKRQSQLTEPLAKYVGKYTNGLAGTFEITDDGKYLAVRMGSLNCRATPFTQKDTIRVVMIPGGSGEVIAFLKGADGTFDSLNYAGSVFRRIGS
ncbi:MAG: serine hydrolase domain-containing protein [Pyrinomonadaceae bacterium]